MASYECAKCNAKELEFILRCCTPENSLPVVYCSQECQKGDWNSHQGVCCYNTAKKKNDFETQNTANQLFNNTSSLFSKIYNIPKNISVDNLENNSESCNEGPEINTSSSEDDYVEHIREEQTEMPKSIEIEINQTDLNNVVFPNAPGDIDEAAAIDLAEKEQMEEATIPDDSREGDEEPIAWHRPQVDDSKRMQLAIMSHKDGLKHIKLRFLFRTEKDGSFEPIDFAFEHIDSTFEASFDVLENYEDFLLISRRHDSINNFCSITFEADFSAIFLKIRNLKLDRREAISVGDRALEMQLNHDVLSTVKQKERIERAYSEAKLEVVRSGVIVIESNADGVYNFAGSSPSRNEACFFYRGTPESIFQMIHKMGDFSLIPDTEKRSKRIGLLFSSIRLGFTIEKSQWKTIDDIKSNNFNFTDGCGFVSPEIISRACDILRKNNKRITTLPCVIQVRFLGFKGILLLKPELKNEIQFRRSMLKFEVLGGENSESFLGIINYSTPFSLTYLNLQSVMLLSALGVDDKTFYDVQEDYFKKLELLLQSPEVAYKFCRLRDRELMEMIEKYGFTKVVINRLRALRRKELERSIKKIKRARGNKYEVERLRIFVPKGRLVYGVSDPYGLLEYGECYFCPTLEDGYARIFKDRKVLVFRNPCYHLGDVRKLRCVDFEGRKYQMYKDVIVFPTRGARPHCNEMSSGDLDGDMFSVLWDENFVDRVEEEEPFSISIPDDDTATRSRRTTSSIKELYERQKWFAKHSSNNSLGQINSAFIKYANRFGPRHPECAKIGALFNMSLDSNVFDEAHLREISRRVHSSAWEEAAEGDKARVWQRLLRISRRRRRALMVDCGIVVFVRQEDGLAVAQCRKRERVFTDANWKNGELKVGDCIKFGVRWSRLRRLLMAENVVLLKDKRVDLVQALEVPRIFGTVTRLKRLPAVELPIDLPDHLKPPTLEGFVYFAHSYLRDILARFAQKGRPLEKAVASYLRFDERSLAAGAGAVEEGDKVSFRLCFKTDGNLAARGMRVLGLPGDVSVPEDKELEGPSDENTGELDVVLEPLEVEENNELTELFDGEK